MVRCHLHTTKLKTILGLLVCTCLCCTLHAENEGWSVSIMQNSTKLCSHQTLEFDMLVVNDTAELDSTSEYRWYIQTPSSLNYEQIDDSISTSYLFNEEGIYWVKASARPKSSDTFYESTPISIELLLPVNAGTISSDQTICYNTKPNCIKEESAPIGGTGVFTRQWQKSVDGTNWSDIDEETDSIYQPDTLTATIYYHLVYKDSCDSVASNAVTITVRPPTTKPSIASSDSILCYNEDTTVLTVETEATGGSDEIFEYNWQESLDSIVFTNISGATGLSYTTTIQSSTRWYRVVAHSNRGCDSIASDPIRIDVYPDWSIINNTTEPLCYMDSGFISVSVSGVEGDCLFQWQEHNDNEDIWVDIDSAKTATYCIPGKTAGVYKYKVLVTPTNGCMTKVSDEFSVWVFDDLTQNTIIGTDTICYNNTPNTLSQVNVPTGGNGLFTYQWQSKTTGNWQDIPDATVTTYQPGPLTTTTYFRLMATTSCGFVTSDSIEVYVRKVLTDPIIPSSAETVCYGFAPALITITTLATCDIHDSLTYQWQQRTTGDWQNIPGATELTYQPETITSTHQYRVIATSVRGCGSRESNVRTINVYDDLHISTSGVAPLCYMTRGTISVFATGEGGSYSYQWQDSVDGIWNNIEGATSEQYQTESKTDGDYFYRCIVRPILGCTPDTSAVIKVTVYPDLTPGTIIGVDTICYNNTPNTLSQVDVPTGGNGLFTYQWQSKTTGGWQDIPDANATTYQLGPLTTTTYFRLVAITSCGFVTSDSIEVYVRKDLTDPIIPSSAETVCYGFAPALITIQTLATCDIHDSLTYQWQQRTTGDWQNIPGATELTYQPEAITSTHQYRVIATSVKGCGSRESNVRTINVYDDLHISTSGVAPLCYMTRGTISVSATGEGGSYSYQWQDSVDGIWNNIEGATSEQYLTESKTDGDYFYRCIVHPTLGCTPDTSAVIKVSVYDSITPGKIAHEGSDTICYGFTHDAISISEDASGGNGSFTYHWMRRQDGMANFSYIPGATSTTYTPTAALYKTTEYQLEVTNACDVKYTNRVVIYVRDEMQAPILADHLDTICYNVIPDPIVASTLAKAGVDDSILYQWETSLDGITFSDIPGETATTYQPGSLLKTQFYRLRASSVKQCGIITSNIVKVNVYDSILITTISPDTLCYMTSTAISASATGGGEDYSYQWQEYVNDEWKNISGAIANSYETEAKPQGTYLYHCIVSSNKCDRYSRISPTIKVCVYEALSPGSITGTDSTCYGFAPSGPLFVDTVPTGVDGNYTYQWQVLENDEWKDIKGETETSYLPDVLVNGTDYRLQVASKCDTLYTNNIFIRVNPLPETQIINGPNNVCYNQHEIYRVEKLNPGYTYEWMVERGEGDLTTEAVNTSSIDILWKNPNSSDSVILHVTNNITGCERDMKFGVSICNEQAPERTIIIRKPNSNILICEEDGEMIYQWGYTEKSTQQEFTIEDSNRRYVLLPHTFDDVTYDYWLTLRHSESSPCYSKSYYSASTDVIKTLSDNIICVPSFIKGQIPIIVNNPGKKLIICSIYSISGEPLARYELGKESHFTTTLPITLHAGMYVMHVMIGDYVESIKLIAE